jgi:hypothetical protein
LSQPTPTGTSTQVPTSAIKSAKSSGIVSAALSQTETDVAPFSTAISYADFPANAPSPYNDSSVYFLLNA